MYVATLVSPSSIPSFRSSPVDSRCAPEWICGRHRADQRADVVWNSWSTRPMTTLPCPEQTKALPMPRDDRFRLHDDERPSPLRPRARQPHAEETVQPREAHSRPARPLQHAELVTQRKHLDPHGRARAQRIAETQDERDENGRQGSKRIEEPRQHQHDNNYVFSVGTAERTAIVRKESSISFSHPDGRPHSSPR
jgi:hypothetical protein